jgi:hypothetical protein
MSTKTPRRLRSSDAIIPGTAEGCRAARTATTEPARQDVGSNSAINPGVPLVGCSATNSTTDMQRTPDKLPDPWLFDSEKLLRELDRCREMVLLIPAPTHEADFAINIAINAIWNLTQHVRYLLALHRDTQRSFAKEKPSPVAPPILSATPRCTRWEKPARNEKEKQSLTPQAGAGH